MLFSFKPTPHEEAAALIEGKPPLVKRIFNELLPELRGRAFTVAGIQSANVLQAIRDEVAAVPRGQKWNDSKAAIAQALEPYLGDGTEEGSATRTRAELVLRVNSYQAFSSAAYRTAHEDPVTTHLQYLHGDCDVPTPSHLALNGVVLPKDDPFWLTHTGPWGHLGCVCYFRTMSPGQVAEVKAKDEKRNPEDQLVVEGPALRKLNEGTLVRGSRTYDVSPPSDPNAFHWHPDNLRIDLAQLKERYDPEVWAVFETFAKKETIDGVTTVWKWLTEKDTFAANPDRFKSPDLI